MKFWQATAAMWSYLYLKLGSYKAWSRAYRAIWERKFKDVKLVTFSGLSQLGPYMKNGALWVKDSWRELFDAVGSPERAQQIFSGAEPAPKEGLDCDEHAIFLTAVLQKSLATGVLVDKVKNPRFFTVMWFEGWKATGHNVCLLELPPAAPLTASGPPRYCYMDYGEPSVACNSIQEVADLIRRSYSKATPENTYPMVWAVSALDLTPELVSRS